MPLDPLGPGDPATVGPHRLLGRIGQGGMGTVYLAVTPDDRAVAVKVLRDGPSDLEGRRRFRRELEVLQRVRGPHLVEVLGGDAAARTPWIVTRFVPGRRLDEQVADSGPLAEPALLRVAAGVAAGLGVLHAAGVVHRDLTPGNVLLVDGEPHVIDLGLAVVADLTAVTRSGLVIGTAGYLAPEQVLGHACGPEADVHAWGATLALAGTGRPPYGTGRPEAVLYRVVHAEPDLAGLPERLLPLVARAMAKDAADRPRVVELVAALAALAVPGRTRDLVGASSGPSSYPSSPVGDLPDAPTDVLRLAGGGALGLPAGAGRTEVLGAGLTEVLGAGRTEVLGDGGTRALAADRTQVLDLRGPRQHDTTALPLLRAEPPVASGGPSAEDPAGRLGPPDGPPVDGVPAPGARGDEDEAGEMSPHRPGALQQAVVAVPLLALLGAVALVAPLAAAGAAVAVLLLVQAATGSGAERRVRVERRGPRRRDGFVSGVGAPWQLLRAAVDLLLGLPLLLVTAGLPAYGVQLLVGGQDGVAAALATGTVLGVVTTLARRRFGATRRALGRAALAPAQRPADAGLLGAVLLAAALLLAGAAANSAPHWWPADHRPHCLPVLPCA